MRAGEALTLHYVENPREVSHATRRKMLWDQHRFDIGDGGGARCGRSPTDLEDDDGATTARTGRRTCDIDDGKERRGRRIYESELVRGKFPPSTREGNDDDPDDGASTGGEETSPPRPTSNGRWTDWSAYSSSSGASSRGGCRHRTTTRGTARRTSNVRPRWN